jgi:peptidoglycan/xylan/chitin deacetylase (PgdA/CDA1 family)
MNPNPSEASLNPSQPSWKRALKCSISLLVFLTDRAGKWLRRVVGQTPKGRCVVLYYHSVPATERQLFAHQLDAVLGCADPVHADGAEVTHRTSGRDCFAVTFDDGFENFLTEALPELERRKIPATVFVIADGMDREFGSAAYAEKLLSLEQLRSLPSGLVTVGSHTMSHPLLTQLEETEARREIRESRTKLEAMLDRPVTEFSFPFGGFNERLMEFCREAGYERAYTTLPAFAFKDRNEFAVGRVRVDPTDWPLEFRLKIAGAYRWLPMVFSLKREIVSLAAHNSARPAVRPSTPRPMVR